VRGETEPCTLFNLRHRRISLRLKLRYAPTLKKTLLILK